jgi:hypothetical protein
VADDIFERLARCTGFEWDEGNAPKIRARQGVTQGECDFASDAEEQEFWATHDTSEYFDRSKARRMVFPDLKPTTTPISMRLPGLCLQI